MKMNFGQTTLFYIRGIKEDSNTLRQFPMFFIEVFCALNFLEY